MKSRTLTCATTVTLLAALAIPVQLAAQDNQENNNDSKHHHYKLIDVGTLGGPAARKSVNAPGYQIINNAGSVSFAADTTMTDPFAPICYNSPDCFVGHAVRWRDGRLTDLGALSGVANGSASGAINGRGWITGQSENGEIDPVSGLPEVRATLWKDDEIIGLGTFGGHWSLGSTLNDAGEVVGFASNTIPDPYSFFPPGGMQMHAFLWRKGMLRDLGTLGGNDAQASSLNQRGLVVGNSYTNSTANDTTGIPTVHPFLWERGRMRDLGTLGGTYAGAGSCGFGAPCTNFAGQPFEGSLLVNNRGQVIGTSNLAGDQIFHPFLWERGRMKDLGTLGGDNGSPVWLTDDGEVVGQADVPNSDPNCAGDFCVHHAFLWKRGVMTDLGTLGSDPCSRALMSNSKTQIVGTTIAVCGDLSTHAFLWENGGPMVDLDTLIPADSGASLFEADNLNEQGEIVASGLPAGCADRFSCGHIYLLTPCDENHSNVEGCDYSLVDAPAAMRVSPASTTALRPASRMPVGIMNRFHLPWGQRNLGSGSRPAPEQKQAPQTVTDDWLADHLLAPRCLPGRCYSGYCEINDYTGGKLLTDGECVSHRLNLCYIQPSANCPKNKPAIRPGDTFCGDLSGFDRRRG
jgi:probable HAF family extracellular repeat protein